MTDSISKKEELSRIVKDKGVRSALQFLNRFTSHRFTALYRFDDKTLKNMFFFDRDHPGSEILPDIPVMASYCVFVRDSSRAFKVENSPTDSRTEGHPKRMQIRAYCGVPLMDDEGKMFGTICHFDENPRPTSAEDFELMEEMAKLLQHKISSL
jgi:GAF domain-containing protein